MLSKKLLVILIFVVVVLVAIGIWVGSWVLGLRSPNPAGPSEYSAVYISTGDIYYGKLDWFPWPRMKNVWFLQRGVNAQNQPQLGIAPFSTAFWGPVDEVYLNPKQIIFWTRLRNDSQVARAFANPAQLQQQQTPPSTSSGQAPAQGFQGPPGPPPQSAPPAPPVPAPKK